MNATDTTREILDSVAASIELEGLAVPPNVRELGRRALSGEITFDQARAILAQKLPQPLSIA
jgi:hypothetical protein